MLVAQVSAAGRRQRSGLAGPVGTKLVSELCPPVFLKEPSPETDWFVADLALDVGEVASVITVDVITVLFWQAWAVFGARYWKGGSSH